MALVRADHPVPARGEPAVRRWCGRTLPPWRSRGQGDHCAGRRIEASEARTVLALDEIHRFNRGQQDVLLEAVEAGILLLIGTTTENPSFALVGALISRSTVLRLDPLDVRGIETILVRALEEDRGLGELAIEADPEAVRRLAVLCDGDARRGLTAPRSRP